MAGKILIIKVEKGRHYISSVKGGREYTSVSCMGGTYGSSCPCDNEDEIKSAIERGKAYIRKMGDIPEVEDNRVTLDQFF